MQTAQQAVKQLVDAGLVKAEDAQALLTQQT